MATYADFLDAVAQRESAGTGGYAADNPWHYLGKWQLGEAALKDCGFYIAGPSGIYGAPGNSKTENTWDGTWNLAGVSSAADFLSNATAQDIAVVKWMEVLWDRYILGDTTKYPGVTRDLDKFEGQTLNGVTLTISGLLGGAHLVGQGALKQYLESGGNIVPHDGNNISIIQYIQLFNGYATPFQADHNGHDVLNGGDGKDQLLGFGDNDRLNGNDDNDTLYGDNGTDTAINSTQTGGGNDELHGGNDNDILYGESGDDHLYGDAGDDRLIGGNGVDWLEGGANSDILYGGNGYDILDGGTGNDFLYGGNGFDAYVMTLNGSAEGVQHDLIRDVDGFGDLVIQNYTGYHSVTGTATYQAAHDYWTYDNTAAGIHLIMTLQGNDLVIKIDDYNYVTIKDFAGGSTNALNGQTFLNIMLEKPPSDDANAINPGDDMVGDGDTDGAAGSADHIGSGATTNMNEWALPDEPEYDPLADPVNSAPGANGPTDMHVDDGFRVIMGEFIDSLRPTVADPLVLDLNGDGLHLVSAGSSNLYFDFNGDNLGEHSGWLAPQDGFLALDSNHNGVIDNVGELFGNLSISGFGELASYDETVNGGNADGILDSHDSVFSDLQIWQDLNSNGVTDTGELLGLGAHGITAFSLATSAGGQFIAGNEVRETATFIDAQGAKTIGEVYFSVDFFNNDVVNGAGSILGTNEDLLELPLSRGYGEVISLQLSMQTDSTLRTLVENLNNFTLTTTSSAALDDLITDILYRWTGADQVASDPYALVDTKKVAAMETFFAQDADAILHGQPMTTRNAALLENAWNQLHDFFAARLLFQGPLHNLTPDATYNAISDNLDLGSNLAGIYERLGQSAWKSEEMIEYVTKLLQVKGDINAGVPIPNEAYALMADYDTASFLKSNAENATNLRHIDGTSGNETISGFAGGAVVHGKDGDDYINSPASNTITTTVGGSTVTQTFYASGFHQFLYGDDGNDTINMQGGRGHIMGGAGNDYIYANTTYDSTIHGGDGDDTIYSGSGGSLLFGGVGADFIYGGSGNDSIYGGTGNDTLDGSSGNDLLNGGEGNDSLSGSSGILNMDGGEGNNRFTLSGAEAIIVGGNGNDTVDASNLIGETSIALGNGDNYIVISDTAHSAESVDIVTGSGADYIYSAADETTVHSGAGDDSIYASQGNAVIDAEDGANYINVQNGGNSVVSGSGNDSIDAGSGNDTINAGDGNNRILVYGTDGITHITTGLGNDNINFYHGVVNAGDGTNYIESGGFNNTITGGSGDDTVAMTGNGDGDTINLGYGNNNLYVAGPTFEIGGNTVYAGNGNDTISIWYQYHSGTYADNYIDIGGGTNNLLINTHANTYVLAGDGNDTISLSGTGKDTVYGGDGDNIINTGTGVDDIYTGSGNDTITITEGSIHAGDGDNILTVGFINTVTAGSGDDYVGMKGDGSTVNLGDGNNTIGVSTPYLYEIGNNHITLGSGDDSVNLSYYLHGVSGDNMIDLGDGTNSFYTNSYAHNHVLAGTGNDSITIGSGNDTIESGGGNDIINAGGGNDQIYGGTGVDTMYGESGNDTFFFTAINQSGVGTGNQDIIGDFTAGSDHLDISHIISSFTWIGGSAFSASSVAEGQLYTDSGGNNIFALDIDGNGTADFELRFNGLVGLSYSDFV